jgi:hypothetical protein
VEVNVIGLFFAMRLMILDGDDDEEDECGGDEEEDNCASDEDTPSA